MPCRLDRLLLVCRTLWCSFNKPSELGAVDRGIGRKRHRPSWETSAGTTLNDLMAPSSCYYACGVDFHLTLGARSFERGMS